MESIRDARPDDLTRCAELLTAARRDVGEARGGALLLAIGADPGANRRRNEGSAAIVGRWAAAPETSLLVGLFDGVVVGMAAGTHHGTTGMIECCYVEPAARGVGVGAALGDALLSWFARLGCTGVDAWALPGDRPTKQMLEAAGFSARLLVLHRRLP